LLFFLIFEAFHQISFFFLFHPLTLKCYFPSYFILVSDLIHFLLILGFSFDLFCKMFDFFKTSPLNQSMLFFLLFLVWHLILIPFCYHAFFFLWGLLLKLFVFSKMFDFLNFTLKSTNIIFLLIYIYSVLVLLCYYFFGAFR